MKLRTVNSQLSNVKTYLAYKDRMLLLAENVFTFKNMNPFIDLAYVNSELLRKGSIAFFYDEVMGLLALPYMNIGVLDIYGRPTKIKPISRNGAYNRILNKDEFVIMYDNNSRIPIYPNVIQHAERISQIKRTLDINISQQKTPRFWETSEENRKTIERIKDTVDANQEVVFTYDNIDINGISCNLNPAPNLMESLNQAKVNEWSEFLELIGISNVSIQKKERMIRDEIITSMGGTIASRFSRFESRKKAIDEINEKWGLNISVEFYDGLPTTIQDPNSFLEDMNTYDYNEEVESDVVE